MERIDVMNLALRKLGDAFTITDETATDSKTVALHDAFDRVLSVSLRSYRWKFATRFTDLVLVKESPTSEWLYAYLYPDCLSLRRLLSGYRQDTVASRYKYRIATEPSGNIQAFTVYTQDTECQITLTAHGYVDGDLVGVAFYDTDGETLLSYINYIVSDAEDNTFKIKSSVDGEHVDSSAWTYANGGKVKAVAHQLVLCDAADAQAELTVLVEDLDLWPQDFLDYMACALAYDTAPLIVGMDRPQIRDQIQIQMWRASRLALANGDLDEAKDEPRRSKYLDARNPT